MSYPVTITHKSKILDGEQGSKLNYCHGVKVVGNYAFVVARLSNALNIIDITNPSLPIVASVLNHGNGGALLTGSENIEIYDNYAYISCLTGNALEIVDISNPLHPIHCGKLEGLSGANQTYVKGDYAYVACLNGNCISVVNISDKSNPILVTTIDDGDGGAELTGANGLWIDGNYLYVASYGGDTLEILDITDQELPVHAGKITASASIPMYLPIDVQVSGNFAIVVTTGSKTLVVIDISDPTSPIYCGRALHDENGAILDTPYGLHVEGSFIFACATASNALSVFDWSDPFNPMFVGSIANEDGGASIGAPLGIFVSGRYAYICGSTSDSLEIVDLGEWKKSISSYSTDLKLVVSAKAENLYCLPFIISTPSSDNDFWNNVLSDGSNIHIYDIDGYAVPYELISIDTLLKTITLWTRVNVKTCETCLYIVCGDNAAVNKIENVYPGACLVHHLEGNTDSGINSYDLTNSNVSFSSAKIKNGGSFVAASSSKLTNSSAANFERTQKFSGYLWIKLSVLNAYQQIMGRLNSGSPYNGWEFTIRDTNKLTLQIRSSIGGTDLLIINTDTATLNTDWHMIGFSYSGNSLATGIKIFIDGNSVDTAIVNNGLESSILASVLFGIGNRNGASLFASGLFDEVFLLKKDLSTEWILNQYNNQISQDTWSKYESSSIIKVDNTNKIYNISQYIDSFKNVTFVDYENNPINMSGIQLSTAGYVNIYGKGYSQHESKSIYLTAGKFHKLGGIHGIVSVGTDKNIGIHIKA